MTPGGCVGLQDAHAVLFESDLAFSIGTTIAAQMRMGQHSGGSNRRQADRVLVPFWF